MGIGHKIKEYRVKAGLTQIQLAEELHVTYQAVSRWENDDAEPSFETLKDICRILKCTTDQLFEIDKISEETKVEEVKQETQEFVKEETIFYGMCDSCHKPIYDVNDYNKIKEDYWVRSGRLSHKETKDKILCGECNKKRIIKEKAEKERQEKLRKESLRKRRICSFIIPAIVSLIMVIIGISCLSKGESDVGTWLLVIGLMFYPFLATIILNNTFITDMWLSVASFGFVKMPGVIFSLSFDGIKFLIFAKLLFWILGGLFAFLSISAATILAMPLSVFAYPLGLKRNFQGIDQK